MSHIQRKKRRTKLRHSVESWFRRERRYQVMQWLINHGSYSTLRGLSPAAYASWSEPESPEHSGPLEVEEPVEQ